MEIVERGIIVSYETIRRWSRKFGPAFARTLRRKAAKPGGIWHLDEVRLVIQGQPRWLWRAVDQDGYVLDEILQTRRNTKVARRLLTRLRNRPLWAALIMRPVCGLGLRDASSRGAVR
ncbi:IS6 family transposase [Acidomonas methanolica]|nr:IS6 family transposase [Acidomonas methanolica]